MIPQQEIQQLVDALVRAVNWNIEGTDWDVHEPGMAKDFKKEIEDALQSATPIQGSKELKRLDEISKDDAYKLVDIFLSRTNGLYGHRDYIHTNLLDTLPTLPEEGFYTWCNRWDMEYETVIELVDFLRSSGYKL